MSIHANKDCDYELYGGIALSHNSVDMAYAMPNPHFHPDYEFFFLIDGGRKFFLSNVIYSIMSHSVLIIPPEEPHQTTINLKTHMERYAIYISPKLLNRILEDNPILKKLLKVSVYHISDPTFKIVIELINKLKTQLDLKDPYSESHLKSIVMEMMILLLRESQTFDKQPNYGISFQKNDIRLQAPIDYILDHYAENITLDQCAEISKMSKSHFSRQFHAVTGISFREYLIKVRIDNACELLKSIKKINMTEAAIQTGFSNSSYFAKCFKERIGMTPMAYKKRHSI